MQQITDAEVEYRIEHGKKDTSCGICGLYKSTHEEVLKEFELLIPAHLHNHLWEPTQDYAFAEYVKSLKEKIKRLEETCKQPLPRENEHSSLARDCYQDGYRDARQEIANILDIQTKESEKIHVLV